jgi:hypothetical protein
LHRPLIAMRSGHTVRLNPRGGRAAAAILAGIAAVALTPGPALAEDATDGLTGSVNMRVRYEALDGQPRAGFRSDDHLLSMRTIAALQYSQGDFRIGGEIDDSRAYLTEPGGSVGAKIVNVFEPVQLYVAMDFSEPFGPDSSAGVKIGRQRLDVGSRRLIASADYRNTTNAYDGIVANASRGHLDAMLFYVLPLTQLPSDLESVLDNKFALDRESFDLRLWGGYLARRDSFAGASVEAGFYRLDENDSPSLATANRHLSTMSLRFYRGPKGGAGDFDLEGAWQTGHTRVSTSPDAVRRDVDAGMFHAHVGYTFVGPARARLSAGYDYVSGDHGGGDYNRFDQLYGARRSDFGPSGIYGAVGRANISSPYVRAEVAPGSRFDAMASFRPMWLASRTDSFSTTGVRDASGNSGNFAGDQLEGRLRYWLVPTWLRAEVDFALLAKGRFLRVAPNAPDAGDTHYIATAITVGF